MSLNQNWELKIDKVIFKKLSRLPKKDVERIFVTIEFLSQNPYSGDIEKIKGEDNAWRRRIGNYRIFYDIKQKERIVQVTWVERRTSKTY